MAFLNINRASITSNVQIVSDFCKKHGIELCVVTKFCCSEPEVVNLLYDLGIKRIADSNQENFERLSINTAGNLIKNVIKTRLSDILLIPSLAPHARPQRVFVSDETLLDALSELPKDICPDIMLIMEVGDLRDGFYPQQISSVCKKYKNLPISGVSVNYACLLGTMPYLESIHTLSRAASDIKTKTGERPVASIGGTVAFSFLTESSFNYDFQNDTCAWELRCGEGIFFGFDSSSNKALSDFKQDVFTFYGEILEIREKEYKKQDKVGCNAFGEYITAYRNGKRNYMVLDFGILAARISSLRPLDNMAVITGQTYDFTVLDITDSQKTYNTGEFMGFAPSYDSVSHAMLNRYVKKHLVIEG